MPGHIPANSPLRPLSPMESAIHDVCSHLNRLGDRHAKTAAGAESEDEMKFNSTTRAT